MTGVDYFSTLGYQPGIAALAAGALALVAALILVLLTLIFGALPKYNRVAAESPHGDGSEHLLSWWQGKLFVLCLICFVTISFIITITLSAADATAHIVKKSTRSPLAGSPDCTDARADCAAGAVFLKGFKEAIGSAVGVVAADILLICCGRRSF